MTAPPAAPAGITFVGSNSGSRAGSTGTTFDVSLTALTGGSDTAAQEGDIVIVVVGTGSLANYAIGVTTAGYAEIAELYQAGLYGITGADLSVSWKVMGSTPDATVTIGPSGATSDAIAAVVHVWRGVDPSSPFDVTGVSASGDGIGRPNPGAITPVTTGAVVLACGSASYADVVPFTSSDLGNFVSLTQSDSHTVAVGLGSVEWTSGAFDPVQFGGGSTGSASAWAAYTMALKPAPAVGTADIAVASSTQVNESSGSGVIQYAPGEVSQVTLEAMVLESATEALVFQTRVEVMTTVLPPVGRVEQLLVEVLHTIPDYIPPTGVTIYGDIVESANARDSESVLAGVWAAGVVESVALEDVISAPKLVHAEIEEPVAPDDYLLGGRIGPFASLSNADVCTIGLTRVDTSATLNDTTECNDNLAEKITLPKL
jgi:hypothetical protein